MVLRAGVTSRETALLARARIMEDGSPILGTILNDWNPKTSGYGGGYYNNYYQSYGNGVKA